MTKVAVIGARGRMGATVCQAIKNSADLQLVAQLDVDDPIVASNLNGAEVAVEFTVPSVTLDNVLAALESGVHVVVGTTGWDEDGYATVREAAQRAGKNVIIAPNYALSAVLAMHFAGVAAPYFETAEVIELHHPAKVDAPSGTAITTAEMIGAARRAANCPPMPDATESDPHNCRGGKIAGVTVHSVRSRGMTAHEEILFGNAGETLSIRSDCTDRVSFMPGVLLAVRKVSEMNGLTVGLAAVMGLRTLSDEAN